jgi:colanic acid biosynthesis glycosyl transferase WcaI
MTGPESAMMRILLFGQHYAPEEISGAVLATELATDLARLGHQVIFVTCAPNYPSGRVFPGYRNRLYQVERLESVRVVRIWSYISPRKTFWPRIMNYLTFSIAAFYGGLLAGKPDVVFSASPPLPLGLSAWLLSRIWRVPWILRVEDLFPEVAVTTGVLRSRVWIKLLYRLEKFLYQKATHISLISEVFCSALLAKGVPPQKMSVIPVWADPDAVQPLPKDNDFRRQHGLDGKFVLLYSGNLGYTSALEDVLEAAALLEPRPEIQIVIVGEGVKKGSMLDWVSRNNVGNILFLPYQSRASFSEMLAAADVGLVTLHPHASHTSLPGKTFNIMASSRPVLAVAPLESELSRIVKDTDCGVVIEPGHPDRLAGCMLELAADRERLVSMGQRGRKQLIDHYSRKRCVGLFAELLESVAQPGRRG